MFSKIVHHLTDSRLFRRPNKSFIELKYQNHNSFIRSTLYKPFAFDIVGDFSRTGFENIFSNPEFSTKAPFHIQIGTNHSASIVGRIPLNFKKLPSYLQGNTFQFALNAKFPSMKNISSVFTFEHETKNRFFSLSYSTFPSMLAWSQHFQNWGYEFLQSFDDEQSAGAVFWNHEYQRTEVSVLVNFYGPLDIITLTDFDNFRISTFFDVNFLTLDSSASFGLVVPFHNSFFDISFKLPERKVSLELSLNHFQDEKKIGTTIFFPFNIEPVLDLFRRRHK